MDGRFKADKEFGKCTSIAFDFFNRSKAKISKIKINKIESTYPLSFEKTVTVEHSTIFQENDSVKCVFLIYHENDLGEIGDRIKMLNIKFYIEVTLVTGVTFEEELRLTNAQFSKAYSRVESLELLHK